MAEYQKLTVGPPAGDEAATRTADQIRLNNWRGQFLGYNRAGIPVFRDAHRGTYLAYQGPDQAGELRLYPGGRGFEHYQYDEADTIRKMRAQLESEGDLWNNGAPINTSAMDGTAIKLAFNRNRSWENHIPMSDTSNLDHVRYVEQNIRMLRDSLAKIPQNMLGDTKQLYARFLKAGGQSLIKEGISPDYVRMLQAVRALRSAEALTGVAEKAEGGQGLASLIPELGDALKSLLPEDFASLRETLPGIDHQLSDSIYRNIERRVGNRERVTGSYLADAASAADRLNSSGIGYGESDILGKSKPDPTPPDADLSKQPGSAGAVTQFLEDPFSAMTKRGPQWWQNLWWQQNPPTSNQNLPAAPINQPAEPQLPAAPLTPQS
jgi:hypothetical protein